MKTKYWICLLGLLLAVCLGLSLWVLLPGAPAAEAQIWSRGELLYTLDLSQDQTLTVAWEGGSNEITIANGRIGVTSADCPDGHCMARGMCSGGAQIVCLPNRLVIRFVQEQPVDGVAG